MKIKKKRLSPNWREKLEIVESRYSKNQIQYTIQLNGVRKNKVIGHIIITKSRKCNLVKIANVIPEMQGKGCGSMLYEHSIKNLGSLSTDYDAASSLAKRVWRKLIKKYRSSFSPDNKILTVYKK